jgi:hypothetical protein
MDRRRLTTTTGGILDFAILLRLLLCHIQYLVSNESSVAYISGRDYRKNSRQNVHTTFQPISWLYLYLLEYQPCHFWTRMKLNTGAIIASISLNLLFDLLIFFRTMEL